MASLLSARQRSAEKTRRQFDRRVLTMVSLMESKDSIFFCKRVNKFMATEVMHGPFAYCLEFPNKFVQEHGDKFDKNVTFVMKNCKRTWPIKVTVHSVQSKIRIFAYGAGGFKTFLQENRIEVGDFLIFSLLRHLVFQVVIERAPVQIWSTDDGDDRGDKFRVVARARVKVHPEDNGKDNDNDNEAEIDMDIDDEEEDKDADKSSARLPPSPPQDADQAPRCSRFSMTVLPSSHPWHFSLPVPGRFWDLHDSMLKSMNLLLNGPKRILHTVKARKTSDVNEEKLSVCLGSGWGDFLVANKL